jgi:hypothetical protein
LTRLPVGLNSPGGNGKVTQKFNRKQILDLMSSTVPRTHGDILKEAIDRIKMSERKFNELWKLLKQFNEIVQAGDKKWTKA